MASRQRRLVRLQVHFQVIPAREPVRVPPTRRLGTCVRLVVHVHRSSVFSLVLAICWQQDVGGCLGYGFVCGFCPSACKYAVFILRGAPEYVHRSGSAEFPLIGAFTALSADTLRSSRVYSFDVSGGF